MLIVSRITNVLHYICFHFCNIITILTDTVYGIPPNVIIVCHSILQLLIRESRENKQVQELPERLCKTASRYVSKCYSHAFADITICNRIYLTHLSLSSFLRDRDKQYRPRSDAAGRGV